MKNPPPATRGVTKPAHSPMLCGMKFSDAVTVFPPRQLIFFFPARRVDILRPGARAWTSFFRPARGRLLEPRPRAHHFWPRAPGGKGRAGGR